MREADCDYCGHLTEGRFLEETPGGRLICLDCDNKNKKENTMKINDATFTVHATVTPEGKAAIAVVPKQEAIKKWLADYENLEEMTEAIVNHIQTKVKEINNVRTQ